MGDDELDKEEKGIRLLVEFVLEDVGGRLDIAFLRVCIKSVRLNIQWAELSFLLIPSTICNCWRKRC